MKTTLLFMSHVKPASYLFISLWIFCFSNQVSAQTFNGDFETSAGPTLSGWTNSCNATSSPVNQPPAGSGSWCIKVPAADGQGCLSSIAWAHMPGYVPLMSNQVHVIQAWGYAQNTSTIGLFLGSLQNNSITVISGYTTSSTTWTNLVLGFYPSFNNTQTPVIILDAGSTGSGQQGFGFFDQVMVVHMDPMDVKKRDRESDRLLVYPNPVSSEKYLSLDYSGTFVKPIFEIYSSTGQLLRRIVYDSTPMKYYLHGLSPGIYHVVLSDGKVAIENKMLAVVD